MRAQSDSNRDGFTIVEIMIAVAILAIVALSITYLVTDSFQRTVQIADAARCNEVLDSAFASLDGFGNSLDPLGPVYDPDENVRTSPTANTVEEFVTDWTPLPMRMNIGGNTYFNNFQKLRSSTAALLAIYNREGSANLYPGNFNYPPTENLIINQFGKLESRNAEFRIQIRPVDQAGNQVNIPSPLGINPINDVATVNNIGNTRWRDDLGMELDIRLLYTDTQGNPQECSRSKAYYFQRDGTLNIDIAAGTNLYYGPIDTLNPQNVNAPAEQVMSSIPWLPNEYYGCSSSDVTLRLNTSAAQIEPASVVMCSAEILDDPGTAADESTLEPATGWTACANITLGGAVTTYERSGMYIYHVQNARTNVTYRFGIAVLDSAGNQATHFETFSLDTERPNIYFFDETVSSLIDPPASMPAGSRPSGSWSFGANTSGFQCSGGQPQFTARIRGSLLSKTALVGAPPQLDPRQVCEFDISEDEATGGLLDPADIVVQPIIVAGDLRGYQCSINTNNDISPNGYRHIVFRSGDLCGLKDDLNGPPANVPENADADYGPLPTDGRYDYRYIDLGESIEFHSVNGWQPNEGAPADKTDEHYLATLTNDLNLVPGVSALYCQASDTYIDTAPLRCEVEPGNGDDGAGNSVPGTNQINIDDERGQTVGRLYDICRTTASAEAIAAKNRDTEYCPANEYYTEAVCLLRKQPADICAENGTSNCWTATATTTSSTTSTTGPVACLDDDPQPWGAEALCAKSDRGWCSGGNEEPCCRGNGGNCPSGESCTIINPINNCAGGPELWGEQSSPFVSAKDVCENFSGTSCYGDSTNTCFTYCGNSTYPTVVEYSMINVRVQGWAITSATASPGSVNVGPLQCAYSIDNYPAGSLGDAADAPVNFGGAPSSPAYGSAQSQIVPKGTVITLKGWQTNNCYPHEGWRNYTGGNFGGSFTSCPSGSDTNSPQGSRDCTFTVTEDEYYLEYNANSQLGGCEAGLATYAIPVASGCQNTCIDRDHRGNCCDNVANEVRFPQRAYSCLASGTLFCYERFAECNATGNGGSPCPTTCTE